MQERKETKSERGARIIDSLFFGKIAYAAVAAVLLVAAVVYVL